MENLDMQQKAKAAVEQALRDWNTASQQPGKAGEDGYASYLTEDAVWLPANAPLQEGREAIMAGETHKLMRYDGVTFNFHATRVEVSASGDLAVGLGAWLLSHTEPGGKEVQAVGKFMDVWRKQPDGLWKCIAAMDNADQPVGDVGALVNSAGSVGTSNSAS
jgi:ketosteroid isomerase-like protein